MYNSYSIESFINYINNEDEIVEEGLLTSLKVRFTKIDIPNMDVNLWVKCAKEVFDNLDTKKYPKNSAYNSILMERLKRCNENQINLSDGDKFKTKVVTWDGIKVCITLPYKNKYLPVIEFMVSENKSVSIPRMAIKKLYLERINNKERNND